MRELRYYLELILDHCPSSSYGYCIKKSPGFLAFSSLKTILGIFLIENEAAAIKTGSNSS
jgi:hypothetical protein